MSKLFSVCGQCFLMNPGDRRLPQSNCSRHPNAARIDVLWDNANSHFYRPVPLKQIRGRFMLCKFKSQCKGESCTFAHSLAEQQQWNKSKDGGTARRPYFGTVHSEPPKRRSSSASASMKPKQPVNHQASVPLIASETNQQHVRSNMKSPSQATAPTHDNRSTILSQVNYKLQFHELITSEQESHTKILQERCNGSYQLVVEEKVYGYDRWMYILDISGDNIAYVTQKSGLVTVTSKNVSIQGTISDENFHHTDEVLYVELNPSDLSRLFNLTSKECSWQVNVTFSLKDSYFASLQRFVRSLAPDIINRLLPSDFPPFTPASLVESYEALNLQICSEDQRNALATIVACPIGSPPVLVTGPFGTGKTRILALAAHYFLQCSTREQNKTCILVCTQQHVSADAFLDCLMNLVISIPDTAYVVRLKNRPKTYKQGTAGSASQRRLRSHDELESDFHHKPPTNKRPYLIVTTCQAAHSLKNKLPSNFYFSHILLDEVAQMREAEAVAPLCLANTTTKIVLAGDKMQVGPDLLVLGEQPRQRGFSRSLLERLEMHYAKSGASAASYIVKLVTNYRCHQDILSLAEKLFYKFPLKSVVPATSTHPEAPFPLVFVCSDLQVPVPSGNPVNEMEARIVIEQVQKFAPGWPQDYWGAKLDPAQICVMSPSRTQVNKMKDLLFSKEMKVPEMLRQVEKHPSYDMQGREYRVLFLSTYEATDEDGNTRNPTKSIADPYVVNTVVTRARSLVVSVGNPYMLLNMEKHMCKKYGEKAKYWSNYIKRCLEHDSVVFHKSTGVFDADKKGQLDQLNRAVDKQIAAKYNINDSTGTYSSEATPTQRQATDLELDECEVPEKYTGRLEFDFTMGEWLGKGGFGHVYEVTSKTDGGSYALKIVRLPDKKSSYKKILREVRGLRKLDQPNNHPNIVRYYGSWVDVAPTGDRKKIAPWKDMEGGKAIPVDDSDSGTSNFVRGDATADTTVTSANYSSDSAAVTKYTKRDDDTSSTTTSTARAEVGSAGPLHGIPYLLIRTELCGRTLKHWLEHHKKRKRQRLLIYFEQILDAVRYIHSKKLAHRDLKPSNIFRSLGDKDVLKVGDFGLVAGNFGSPDLTSQSRSRQQVSFSGQAGTPLYMSPEQLEHTRCTEKVDIYALGVIYFEMNYVTVHEKHKVLKDLQKDFHVPHKFATLLPYETTVIQKMMTHDPDHRPTANHILESRWFDDLKKSVQENPGHVPSM